MVRTVLYSFEGGAGGDSFPKGGVIFSSGGVLYGTVSRGPAPGLDGMAFSLTPPGSGQGDWTESVLYRFHRQAGSHKGVEPWNNLVLSPRGPSTAPR